MAKRRNRNRVNATGRNNTSRFVRLDYRILNSNAYRSLCPNARSLLVELIMLYNGENNGSLYLGVRDAAHRMGIADLTAASRSFDELTSLGFIELAQEAYFKVKASESSRARCWRLTWLVGPGRKAPSWEFLEREPEPQTKARRRMERGLKTLKAYHKARDQGRLPVLDSGTFSPFRPAPQAITVLDSDTLISGNGGFPPDSRVRDSAAHIATPWGLGATKGLLGWWQPDWTPSLAGVAFAAALAKATSAGASNRKVAA
ncbi:hypothetical protein BSL82_05370 [Tardibacter chloracetimidivorans]|uniref:Uncharacterized protein n=1 Tax=Tardibacter chloracetimidivorans TaxID=1921510 RepID=A0A1L3ZT54_9SPHN|nr:hypothetical protein BSL82_05370 [Tardibacter chloracetimidivorans]